jgi:hypothetical protein
MVNGDYCKRTIAAITDCIAQRRRRHNKNQEQFCKALQEVTELIPFVQNNELTVQGIYHGYPRCCIEAFVDSSKPRRGLMYLLRKRMSRCTGFMPCYRHAKLLRELDGAMCICDVLENRIDTEPFVCSQFCVKKREQNNKIILSLRATLDGTGNLEDTNNLLRQSSLFRFFPTTECGHPSGDERNPNSSIASTTSKTEKTA